MSLGSYLSHAGEFHQLPGCSIIIVGGARNRLNVLVKLVGSVGFFLFLCFKLLKGQWNLREFVIHGIDILVDSVELLKKMIPFGL